MFSRVRIAIRFFFVGLAVGILLAPRRGEETRRMIREKADHLLNDILDAASLGQGADDAKPASKGNGAGSRTRSRAKATAEEAASEAV